MSTRDERQSRANDFRHPEGRITAVPANPQQEGGKSDAAAEKTAASVFKVKLAGASRDDLEAHGRKRRNGSGGAAVKVSRLKVPLPGGTLVQVSGQDISLDDAIEAAQEAVKALRKAREDGLDSKTAQAVFRDKAKKAGE